MRINVYSQELTKEVTIVQKVAADTGITYFGIRLFLASLEAARVSFSDREAKDPNES